MGTPMGTPEEIPEKIQVNSSNTNIKQIMELRIKDRLYLPAFLSGECNFRQFNLKKEILKKIQITEQEKEAVGLKENTETKRIEWDVEKDVPVIVEFTADELAFLKESCEKVSDDVLPDDMWATVELVYDSVGN